VLSERPRLHEREGDSADAVRLADSVAVTGYQVDTIEAFAALSR
jgi:hypothetical protein